MELLLEDHLRAPTESSTMASSFEVSCNTLQYPSKLHDARYLRFSRSSEGLPKVVLCYTLAVCSIYHRVIRQDKRK